jgi:phage shock protein A
MRSVWCGSMSTSDATRLARAAVRDIGSADDATKILGAVLLLLADEVDRLTGVVERLHRRVR